MRRVASWLLWVGCLVWFLSFVGNAQEPFNRFFFFFFFFFFSFFFSFLFSFFFLFFPISFPLFLSLSYIFL